MRTMLLIAFAFLLAAGQILFKRAAIEIGPSASLAGMLNGWMIAALALYGLATLLWVHILRSTPLSAAYPFAALGFVIVPVAAHLLFGERLGPAYLAGAALIALGIVLTSL